MERAQRDSTAEMKGGYVRKMDPTADDGAYVVLPCRDQPVIRFTEPEASDSELKFDFEIPADGLYFITLVRSERRAGQGRSITIFF